MDNNIRPETMERITTPELANAFIDEQISSSVSRSAQRRCCWRYPAALTRPSLPHF